MEHYLRDKWTFWFILFNHQKQKSSQYQIEEIHTVETVESFLQLFNSLPKITEIKNVNNKRVSLGLFMQNNIGVNIKPLWEDPENSNGGSFNFLVTKSAAPEIWKNLLLSIIGGSLQINSDDNDCILGVTIGPKTEGKFGIEIWNRNKDTKFVNVFKESIIGINGINGTVQPKDIYYKPHK